MAQIVGYPGVYVEEFTPPSPIEGVGTGTAAFVGTAAKGPVGRPTRLGSWDAFVSTFGGFLTEQPASFLAPAVYGFFLNGGIDCFVVRAGTATHASGTLVTRRTPAQPLLEVTAIEEGASGGDISIVVRNSSLLTTRLGTAGPLTVHRSGADLANALPTTAGSDRHTIKITLPLHAGTVPFRIGERVVVQDDSPRTSAERTVVAIPDTTTVVLSADVPGNYGYGNRGRLRSVDITPGQRDILVEVPPGVRLAQVLPRGTTLTIGPDFRTVETAGDGPAGPAIRITTGMTTTYDLGAAPGPALGSAEFDLVVTRGSDQESFTFLSVHPDHPNYWAAMVDSDLVVVADADPPPAQPAADPRPAPTTAPMALTPGQDDDRALAWSNLIANPAAQLNVLGPYEEIDIVAIPGATTSAAQVAIVQHCEDTRRFAVLDSVRGHDLTAIEAQVDTVRGTRVDRPGHAALYYPWLRVLHPTTNRAELWPPSGHVVGLYARTDGRGVHIAPANDGLRGAFGLETRLTDLEQAPLNLNGINVLRIFPGNALPVVWGARTTYKQNKYWQYVNIRRLFLFVEKSIEQGIRWAVFQPNNEDLWQRLKRTISDFLTRVWRDGALFGAKPDEAFYVRIDRILNPNSEQVLGRLHIEIGIRPAYPAEFIVVRFGIWEGGSEVSEN